MRPLVLFRQEHRLGMYQSDVIMSTMASQITRVSIVYSIVRWGADERKHQSSVSLAFVRGIHRWPVNSPHKGPVTCASMTSINDEELNQARSSGSSHDDVIKWKHFPRYWPFVRGIHRSPVNSPQKGQRRGALMFSLICVWINSWVNNRKAGD